MFSTLRRWWFGESTSGVGVRSVAWVPRQDIPCTPQSRLPGASSLLGGMDDSIPPPEIDPRILYPMLRRLRDHIPDVSAGIWAWVRLCSTPQSMTFSDAPEEEVERCKGILQELDQRITCEISERDRGIEALIHSYFLSIFTYGCFCGEIVLDANRQKIDRFIVIDPATIRFKRDHDTRALRAMQVVDDGRYVALNPCSFFYHALDSDGLSPYGRSPLLALPLVVKIQQQILHDMAMAQHNAGYPTIHFCMERPQQLRGESNRDYLDRMGKQMRAIEAEVQAKKADSNLVTFDNLTVKYVGPNGNSVQWSESIQVVSEQVISALHLAPFMIGRNWGTTQSWGTAQYQLLTNNARTVQEGAKRLAEWLRNLELLLHGSTVKVTHHFAPHHHLDMYDRARSVKTLARMLMELKEQDILSAQEIKQKINACLEFL